MAEEEHRARSGPDRHALNIAGAVQEAVQPDLVILFGSRAVGDHRDDSDIDILVVTGGDNHIWSEITATQAARSYMRENPPELELGIISMDRKKFDRCRLANQHIAGQAVLHGVIISGERLEYHRNYDDEYPAHWPETQQRIQGAEEWRHVLDELVEENHWNKKLIGLVAQQAVENALKGWLSTHNDTGRFGHDLDLAWNRINELEDWAAFGMEKIRESVQELFDYTRYEDVTLEDLNRTGNWLTKYAAIYRYSGTSHIMSQQEQKELQEKANRVLENIIRLIHHRSGTTETDTFPDGVKPWDL